MLTKILFSLLSIQKRNNATSACIHQNHLNVYSLSLPRVFKWLSLFFFLSEFFMIYVMQTKNSRRTFTVIDSFTFLSTHSSITQFRQHTKKRVKERKKNIITTYLQIASIARVKALLIN